MKRKFLFVLTSVFFLAVTPFVSAMAMDNVTTAVEQELTFTDIEVSEVPSEVIEAAKKEFPGTEVEKAQVAEVSGEKIYKIVVKNSDDVNQTGLYNSNGDSYVPEA